MAIRRFVTTGAVAFALLASAFAVQLGGGVPAAHGFDPTKLSEEQDRLLSGFASFELTNAARGEHSSKVPTYFAKGKSDCTSKFGDNVKVNQNCLNLADPDLQG